MNLLKSVNAALRANIPVGVATMNDSRIILYVIDPEQNLLQLVLSAENIWTGVGLGAPPGVGLTRGIGATADPAGTPSGYAFVLGDDGNIWTNFNETWTSLPPMPDGIIPDTYIGATVGIVNVNVYVVGSDRNLYLCTYAFASQNNWTWSAQSFLYPIFATIGVTGWSDASNGGPYCVALGTDGNIYCNSSWNLDAPPGVQIAEPIGVTIAESLTEPDGGQNEYVTAAVIDSTNNVWAFQFDTASQQAPSRIPLLSGQGSTPVIGVGAARTGDTCAIYVLCEDNTLSMSQWSIWYPLGTPSGKLVRPIGVAANMELTCAFVADENGVIWCHTTSFRDVSGGSWANVA